MSVVGFSGDGGVSVCLVGFFFPMAILHGCKTVLDKLSTSKCSETLQSSACFRDASTQSQSELRSHPEDCYVSKTPAYSSGPTSSLVMLPTYHTPFEIISFCI